jgi:hypothetical protein
LEQVAGAKGCSIRQKQRFQILFFYFSQYYIFAKKTKSLPMKKLYTAIVAALLIASIPAVAQKGLYVGVSGAIQSTWVTNQNNYGLPEMDYNTTFHGAANINIGYDFTDHLGVKAEVGYATYGQKYKDQKGDSTLSREVKMNHYTIPVMFKYRVGGKVTKFYVAVGPQFDLLSSASQTYTLNNHDYVDTLNTLSGKPFNVGASDITDRYNSLDIMARMDLGVDITLIEHLVIELGLKFGYGLMDINASDFQLPDHSGAYHPSHNVFGGLVLGVNWHF